MNEVFAAISDYTYAFDRAGVFAYVNAAGARVLGRAAGELVGRSWREMGFPVEIMEAFESQWERVVVTRRAVSSELPFPTPQGTRLWEYTLSPVCAADGSVEMILARVHETADRADPSTGSGAAGPVAGAGSEAVRGAFVWHAEITADGDRLLWDLRMDEVAAQRVFPLALEPGESYANAWYWSRLDEDRLRADAHGLQEIRAGRSYSQEFRCRDREGHVRWLSEEVQLETVGPGHWRALGVCRDLTEREQEQALDPRDERVRQERVARAAAERRCEEVQDEGRRKDDFLAMLAHELRNPLAPILNAVQVMRLRSQADAPQERAREVVERQVRHMARLLDDLLDVSRITRGMIELRREPVDLVVIVADALQTSRPFLEAQRHEILLALPSEPIMLAADATRLEQVVTNLLNNAAKYTPAEGRLWITLAREGGEAVLSVRDTGLGLTPELLPRVFDLFTQAARTLDRSQGGLGVGLTLVRRLVELHGGSVSAASPGPGQGSEFVVRLPVTNSGTVPGPINKDGQDGATASRASLEPRDDAPSIAVAHPPLTMDPRPSTLAPGHPSLDPVAGRRVLLVEDHTDAAQTLATLLELWGHEVRVALDGPMALEAATEFQPEVVLMDIGLPGMDGYEVARRLRGEPELAGALLVAVTGYGQTEDRSRSRAAGFTFHLTKPVNPVELARVITGPGAEVA